MMLKNYWPQAAAVNACIKNEAETADISVLLAVHQPSPLVQRNAGTNLTTAATEKDLLDAFLTNDVPGGALIVPITGPSGVGKSHIIRWLDAQLHRSPKREQLHIIRIPKSASLRTVVELILAPLGNDPRYAKPSADLNRAVAEVNVKDAVITFRAHLENALSARHERMVAELREHPNRTHLKALIGHAEKLPRLFSDAALDQHFITNVLTRVVARAIGGRSESDDETLSQFNAEDLILPREIDLNQAARQVREYYQVQIAIAQAERLKPIVDLLNDAVDPAIANVFQLEQSTGGMTLQDIILAVRKILFEDGKDLVLLIEDFQALAGIQDVLLKVCIQEGEYDGKKVRATMRTAIALTDGYLAFRDTILTRAQREWVIGSHAQSDEEIKAGVIEMVGAYLNAARWGEQELLRLFKQRDSEQSIADWIPVWRDEDLGEEGSEAVPAFGFNAKGVSLFPFNRNAIEQLAERHLSQVGKLIFNPRRVINEILRQTLLMRPSYESGQFPPSDFQDFRPNATIANWVRQSHQAEQTSRRLATLLAVWGGNPVDVAAIGHIPPAVFTTFRLPTPAEIANILFVPEPPRVKVPGSNPIKPLETERDGRTSPVVPAVDPEMEKWRTRLEAWAAGTQLPQKEANDVRSALFAMMKDALNWPSLRMREPHLRASWITIPNARSNPQSGRQLKLCEDHRDENGTVRAGILGAVRFAKEKRWIYPGADDDYIASAALVDHLLAQMTPLIVEDAKAEAAALARTLVTQSRIAGLSPPIRPSGADATLAALFAKPETKEKQGFEDNWDKVRDTALGCIGTKTARDVLQSELLERVASFQGTGGKAFAVDIARLLDLVAEDAVPEAVDRLPDEVKTFIRPLGEPRLWGQLTQIVAKLREFRTYINEFLDEKFDKLSFISDLQEIIRLLSATGSFPSDWPTNLRDFERRLVEFQASPIVDLVTKAATIVDEADREQIPKLLNALGSLDLGLIGRTMEVLASTNTLIAAAEKSVAREEADRSQADPETLCGEITTLLEIVGGSVQTAEAAQ